LSGRIAYLGPEGTFCEEALIGMVGAEAAAAEVPYPSIAACFDAVASGEVAEALVPIENALEGGVTQTLDQLMAHDALGAHARDELGISEIQRARPVQAALASAATFAVGAGLPLLITLLVPARMLTVFVSCL
jgi:prephenate dehydratase